MGVLGGQMGVLGGWGVGVGGWVGVEGVSYEEDTLWLHFCSDRICEDNMPLYIGRSDLRPGLILLLMALGCFFPGRMQLPCKVRLDGSDNWGSWQAMRPFTDANTVLHPSSTLGLRQGPAATIMAWMKTERGRGTPQAEQHKRNCSWGRQGTACIWPWILKA